MTFKVTYKEKPMLYVQRLQKLFPEYYVSEDKVGIIYFSKTWYSLRSICNYLPGYNLECDIKNEKLATHIAKTLDVELIVRK